MKNKSRGKPWETALNLYGEVILTWVWKKFCECGLIQDGVQRPAYEYGNNSLRSTQEGEFLSLFRAF